MVAAAAAPETKVFEAKNPSSQSRVETWRRLNRLLILSGIPSKTPLAEFQAACLVRLSQHDSPRFEWEPASKPARKHRGRVALGFRNAEVRYEAEQRLAQWVWKVHPIYVENATNPVWRALASRVVNGEWADCLLKRPPKTCSKSATETNFTTNIPSLPTNDVPSNTTKSMLSAQTTKETATFRQPPSQPPPAAEIIDLAGSSSPAPARPLINRLTTPVNVPCAAATAVQEASCIAAEAAAAADAAVAEAHAATFRAFTAEASGDVAAAAAAREEASAADERARSAYGAAATAARIASAYSFCISLRNDFRRY